MTPYEAKHSIISDALDILPAKLTSDKAICLMLAIGLQESRLEARRQVKGPARGLWQFERGGGVRGVLKHNATAKMAVEVCDIRGVQPTEEMVYARLEFDDVLAAAFARMLIYTDPKPLPEIGEFAISWDYYTRTWRPGKPHRNTWDELYASAMEAMS